MKLRVLLLACMAIVVAALNLSSLSAQEPSGEWGGGRPIGPSSTYGNTSFFDTLVGPLPIPELGTASDSIVVTQDFPIVDMDLLLDIPHTWVGDLTVTLTHVDTGTSAIIIDRPGSPPGFGCPNDNIDATLDDEAASPVEGACAGAPPAIVGTFIPNQSLSVFDGESTAGTWTLQASDVAAPDVGTLNGWQMNVRGSDATNVSAPFLAIPDSPSPGVTDSLPITSKGIITDLNLLLVIGHTWVGDLVVTLRHEETGTEVTVIDRPGVPNSVNGCSGNDINVGLDDEALTPVETQCSGAAPTIGGTFQPNNPLSAFDGESIGGTWTLRVSDHAAADTGQLTLWVLQAETTGCPAGTNNGFEDGVVDTSFAPCWTTTILPGSAGSWCNYAGIVPPACGLAPVGVPAPPQGTKAVMTNEGAQSAMVIYRCGIPTAGGLRFQLYLNTLNVAGWQTGPNLIPVVGNQQFRADLVSRDAILDDPFTVEPQHILMNLYQTQPPHAVDTGTYGTVLSDISAFIGQTVCLRFAAVAGDFYLLAGIDDVVFQAKEPKVDPDEDAVQNDVDPDDDNDGCTDARENQTAAGSQFSGGRRNPHNFWDLYDVPTGGGLTRNGSVSAPDIFGVLGRFNTSGSPSIDPLSPPPPAGYHTAYDRGSSGGPNPWNLTAANGSIAATDIFGVIAQFNHSCT